MSRSAWLVLVICFFSAAGSADERNGDVFAFATKRPLKKHSSTYFRPLASFVLPGFGQFTDGQTEAGLVYSIAGGAGAGIGFVGLVQEAADNADSAASKGPNDFQGLSDRDKTIIWGLQLYQTA